ncbi:TolC family protein [Synechococcus sp. MEDNS5]|uniref:TolC family protein n=1 Tax=Synechococcus sp. MEDNS5 TaxID=1442554 RepID=UPI0016448257|nr:TolC family protein [Synechococcus sp. MEDNS5]
MDASNFFTLFLIICLSRTSILVYNSRLCLLLILYKVIFAFLVVFSLYSGKSYSREREPSGLASASTDQLPLVQLDTSKLSALPKLLSLVDDLNLRIRRYEQLSKPITLKSSLELTLVSNPTLASYRNLILSEFYNFKASQSSWFPSIIASPTAPAFGQVFSSTKTGNSADNISPFSSSTSTITESYQFTPGIVINWSFLDFSRQPFIDSRFQAFKQNQFLYASAVRDQLLSVQTNYYQIQASAALIAYYKPLAENLLDEYILQLAQFDEGLIDVGSLSQQRSQLFQTINQMIGFYDTLFSSSYTLADSIGLSPDSIFRPTDKLLVSGKWPLSLEDTLVQAETSREDIFAAIAAVKEFDDLAKFYIRQYLPTFSLYATASIANTWGSSTESYFRNGQSIGSRRVPSTYDNTASAAVGINFSWSIFDGANNYFTSKSNKETANSNRNKVLSQVNSVSAEVKSAYSLYVSSRSQLTAASESLKAAQISQEVALERFRVGISNITTFIQTVQLYSTAAVDYTEALQNYNISLAQLYRYSASFPLDVANIDPNSFFYVQ